MTRHRIAQIGENRNPKSPENRPQTRRFLQIRLLQLRRSATPFNGLAVLHGRPNTRARTAVPGTRNRSPNQAPFRRRCAEGERGVGPDYTRSRAIFSSQLRAMTSALPSFAVKCAVTMKLSFSARSSTAARTAAVQLFRCSIACTVIAAFADNGSDAPI